MSSAIFSPFSAAASVLGITQDRRTQILEAFDRVEKTYNECKAEFNSGHPIESDRVDYWMDKVAEIRKIEEDEFSFLQATKSYLKIIKSGHSYIGFPEWIAKATIILNGEKAEKSETNKKLEPEINATLAYGILTDCESYLELNRRSLEAIRFLCCSISTIKSP